jgi:hypothetical protein
MPGNTCKSEEPGRQQWEMNRSSAEGSQQTCDASCPTPTTLEMVSPRVAARQRQHPNPAAETLGAESQTPYCKGDTIGRKQDKGAKRAKNETRNFRIFYTNGDSSERRASETAGAKKRILCIRPNSIGKVTQTAWPPRTRKNVTS